MKIGAPTKDNAVSEKAYCLDEIAKIVNGVVVGKTTHRIIGPEKIETAGYNHITFIRNMTYLSMWESSKACAALVNVGLELDPGPNRAIIKVKNIDQSMVQLLGLFKPDLAHLENENHPSAVIHPSATIGRNVGIGAGCYIGKDVIIGHNVKIYPNVTILEQSIIGDGTIVWPGTVIRERCQLGILCIIHPNVTIGADGFGYCPQGDQKGFQHLPHIGNVIIGNYVEIGSGTCIDRGKFSATSIGDGCKIDNLCQIAHNCTLGRHCLISGNSGLAGSVVLGDRVTIAGSVSIKDHVTIGDKAMVGGGSVVLKDVPAGHKVLGYPAMEYYNTLKHWVTVRNPISK